jgi:hypothetical protein
LAFAAKQDYFLLEVKTADLLVEKCIFVTELVANHDWLRHG